MFALHSFFSAVFFTTFSPLGHSVSRLSTVNDMLSRWCLVLHFTALGKRSDTLCLCLTAVLVASLDKCPLFSQQANTLMVRGWRVTRPRRCQPHYPRVDQPSPGGSQYLGNLWPLAAREVHSFCHSSCAVSSFYLRSVAVGFGVQVHDQWHVEAIHHKHTGTKKYMHKVKIQLV